MLFTKFLNFCAFLTHFFMLILPNICLTSHFCQNMLLFREDDFAPNLFSLSGGRQGIVSPRRAPTPPNFGSWVSRLRRFPSGVLWSLFCLPPLLSVAGGRTPAGARPASARELPAAASPKPAPSTATTPAPKAKQAATERSRAHAHNVHQCHAPCAATGLKFGIEFERSGLVTFFLEGIQRD